MDLSSLIGAEGESYIGRHGGVDGHSAGLGVKMRKILQS